MAPTHTKSTVKVASKRPRRVIDLETKLKLIKDYEGGKSVMVIARQSGMSHSTIATILKNKNKVTEALKGSVSLKATRLTNREGPISDMEKLLMTWIQDQTRKRIPLSTMMITAKAKSLFAMLKEKAGPDCNVEFTASPGWFKRFKNRYSLHNVKVSADVATKECMNCIWKKTLKKFAHDFKGFTQEKEVTNMDQAVVEMANNFTLGVEEDDVEELLDVVPEELTSEVSWDQERRAQEEAREKETAGEEKELPRKFTVTGLAEAFIDLSKLLKKFESMDPNPERFSLIKRNVHGALSVYRQIYEAERKQTNTDIFLREVAPQEEPQAGPSRGVIIIGDDGTMRIIVPEDRPVDCVGEGEDSDIDDLDLV